MARCRKISQIEQAEILNYGKKGDFERLKQGKKCELNGGQSGDVCYQRRNEDVQRSAI